MKTAEGTRIRRKFFLNVKMAKEGSATFSFFVSHQPDGIMRSGKPYVCISSQGTRCYYTVEETIYRVGELKRLGWRDLRDPGYDKPA